MNDPKLSKQVRKLQEVQKPEIKSSTNKCRKDFVNFLAVHKRLNIFEGLKLFRFEQAAKPYLAKREHLFREVIFCKEQ